MVKISARLNNIWGSNCKNPLKKDHFMKANQYENQYECQISCEGQINMKNFEKF